MEEGGHHDLLHWNHISPSLIRFHVVLQLLWNLCNLQAAAPCDHSTSISFPPLHVEIHAKKGFKISSDLSLFWYFKLAAHPLIFVSHGSHSCFKYSPFICTPKPHSGHWKALNIMSIPSYFKTINISPFGPIHPHLASVNYFTITWSCPQITFIFPVYTTLSYSKFLFQNSFCFASINKIFMHSFSNT